jgi:sRNA-binding protein
MYNLDNPREIISLLAEQFPKAFFEDGRQRRPLKKTIASDIVALGLEELKDADIGRAVSYYVNHYGYHKTIVAGTPRIDLDGNVCGVVTEAEQREALVEINAVAR